MKGNNSNIKAVLDNDLEKLLKQTKQYNAFIDGELQCKYCRTTITVDNLSIIIPTVKEETVTLDFCCNKSTCLAKFRNEHERN